MTGPLTVVRRLTSTATGLVGATVRTGVGVASTAVHGALHLVGRGDEGRQEAGQQAPEPVRVPTPPDPAVQVARQQAEASSVSTEKKAARKPAKKAPSAKAATTGPAKAARAVKAAPTGAKATPKPAAPRKKASEVPLKSDPTPASAAPPEPEGPDMRPGDGGATGLAEAEPLLEPGVAAQVRAESEQLRSAAE